MKLALGAGVVAIVFAIVVGPLFIGFFRRRAFGQQIREEGPAGHHHKQGTPTMGGLFLLLCSLAAFAIFSKYTAPALTVAGVTIACAAIGFVDDYFKLVHKRSLGLAGRWKMLLLLGVTAGLGYAAHRQGLSTDVYVPLIDIHVDLGPAYYVLLFLVVAGGANAVNLTDGLDGLAAGTMTIAMLTYTAMMVVAFLSPAGLTREGDPQPDRPGDHQRGAGRRVRRVPLVQRLPGRCLHGRHRLASVWAVRWRRWRCSPRPSSCWC